jgi:hypothetical protein
VYLLWQLTIKSGDVIVTNRHHRSASEKKSILPATEDVKIELQRLFKKSDTTADGKITKKELAWAISK